LWNVSDGTAAGHIPVGEASGQWFEFDGKMYALLAGGLVRLERPTSGAWRIAPVLQPQGAIDSLTVAGDAIAFSTGIGSAPEHVLLIEP